jgi:hypothetical protein
MTEFDFVDEELLKGRQVLILVNELDQGLLAQHRRNCVGLITRNHNLDVLHRIRAEHPPGGVV